MTVYREVSELPRCGSCGKLLTTGGTVEERMGRRIVFCGERCIRVFDTYKAPKYGEAAIWPESVVE